VASRLTDEAPLLHTSSKTPKDEAETLAFSVASFLFSDEDRLSKFFGITGINADDLRTNLTTPDIQIGILEYLLSREDILLEFCEANNVDPEYPKTAMTILSGERPDW
tara:strand:+ start:161 stop:484 length:324 start_codon:yes stop_codon:yes gene_type:complete